MVVSATAYLSKHGSLCYYRVPWNTAYCSLLGRVNEGGQVPKGHHKLAQDFGWVRRQGANLCTALGS